MLNHRKNKGLANIEKTIQRVHPSSTVVTGSSIRGKSSSSPRGGGGRGGDTQGMVELKLNRKNAMGRQQPLRPCSFLVGDPSFIRPPCVFPALMRH